MSNLSDIGFPVASEQDVNQVIVDILPLVEAVPCPPYGYYFKFEDESGAQIFLQTNTAQEIIGFNPAFLGSSEMKAGITKAIERDFSELDGAFHAWADPEERESPEESGAYPFVFDVPDFRVNENISIPSTYDVCLTAFASNEFELFGSDEEFAESQDTEIKFASNFFVPTGLIPGEDTQDEEEAADPKAHALFAAKIVGWEKRTNSLTRADFYWFYGKTLGGAVDIVADPRLIKTEPVIGGIVTGAFWLAGRILRRTGAN